MPITSFVSEYLLNSFPETHIVFYMESRREMGKMHLFVDLRYVVPALINLGKPWVQDPSLNNPIFVMASLFLAIVTLIFLFTSVKLPLTLSVEPVRLRAGHFSSPLLTLSLLASLFLPSSLFWYVFPILISLSPWYEILLNLLKRFMLWFCDTLQVIPVLIITCITQCPQVEPDEEAIQIEGNNETNV